MAVKSESGLTRYAGRVQPISGLSEGQLAEKRLWNKQMKALGAQEEKDKKEKEKKDKEKNSGGGTYKRMQLARLTPKTRVAEVLSVLYDNEDPFLKAMMKMK